MLTLLSTVKTRLGLTDSSQDSILTNAIQSVSVQFDRLCNRTFARTVGAKEEFGADEIHIRASIYPIETVAWFELKNSETEGWMQVTPDPEYILRSRCVISLGRRLGNRFQRASVVYTAGYVLPGTPVQEGQTALPADIEQACVEQVAYWFQNRSNLAPLVTVSQLGTSQPLAKVELLPSVMAILKPYKRWII